MNYEEAKQFLLDIPSFTKKNTMENTREYLHYLGIHTDALYKGKKVLFEDMPHVIHVAGTNGKGSVCAFLNGILTQAGYKTGMFTSPHLVEMTERFCINGIHVGKEKFADVCSQVKRHVEKGIQERRFSHPTFFEFLVGMAFVLFQEEQVDYMILETGLGGRLDATNIVKQPLACVITTIGYDHTEYLGGTIEEIAQEKAGIIKEGVPVVYDAGSETVSAVIERQAAKLHARTFPMTKEKCEILYFDKKNIDFLWKSEYYNNMRIHLSTSALYQIQNAALAALTIEQTDREHRIDAATLAEGIRRTRWQGRMEWLWEYFLIDGAHNESGMMQALGTIGKMQADVILIYAAVRDKNYEEVIRMLCEKLSLQCVIVTQPDTPRAVVTEELAGIFARHYTGPIYREKCVGNAMAMAQREWDRIVKDGTASQQNTIIFGTGSLYLVGALKAQEQDRIWI